MVTPVTGVQVNTSANPVLDDLTTQLAQLMAAIKNGNVDAVIKALTNIGTDWSSLLQHDSSFANNADVQNLQYLMTTVFSPAMAGIGNGNMDAITLVVQTLSQPGSAIFTQLQADIFAVTADVNSGKIN